VARALHLYNLARDFQCALKRKAEIFLNAIKCMGFQAGSLDNKADNLGGIAFVEFWLART
jgi:hypothetical protein